MAEEQAATENSVLRIAQYLESINRATWQAAGDERLSRTVMTSIENRDRKKAEQLERQMLATEEMKKAQEKARNQEKGWWSSLLDHFGWQRDYTEREAKKENRLMSRIKDFGKTQVDMLKSAAKGLFDLQLTGLGLVALYKLFQWLREQDWAAFAQNVKDGVNAFLEKWDLFKEGILGLGELIAKITGIIWARSVLNSMIALFGPEGRFKGLADFFKTIGKGMFGEGSFVRKVLNWIKGFFSAESGLGKLWTFLSKTGLEVKTAITGGKEGNFLTRTLNWIKSFFSAESALGRLWTNIKSIGATVKNAITGGKEGNFITKTLGWVKGFFSAEGALGKAFTALKESKAFTKIKTFLGAIGSKFLKFLGPVTWIIAGYEAVTAFMDAFNAEEGSIWDKTVAGLTAGIKALVDFFVFDLIDIVEKGVKWLMKKFLGLFGVDEKEVEASDWYNYSLTDKLREWTWAAIDAIAAFFTFQWVGDLWGELVAGATSMWTWFKTSVVDPVIDFFVGIFKWGAEKSEEWGITDFVIGVFNDVKAWFGKLFKFDSASDVITSAVNFLTFMPNLVKDAVMTVTEWLLGLFGFDEEAKKVANAKKFSIGDMVMNVVTSIVEWFEQLFNLDIGKIFSDALGALGEAGKKILSFFDFGDDEVKETKVKKSARGGLLKAGEYSLVGEEGPELIRMGSVAGKVIPNKESMGMMSAPTIINAPSSTTSNVSSAPTSVVMGVSSTDPNKALLSY